MFSPIHLHFVQSLEPLQGAGLGQAALSLHLAMRCSGNGSILLSTRGADFDRAWPDVIQGVRHGPDKAFYAPELKKMAADAVADAQWFHGHGLYVWPNMWLGGEARRRGKPLVYHPQGFFDPWILRRSPGKKRIAHWLFEDKNFAHVRWWRALSAKEADQIRTVAGAGIRIEVIPNGIDLEEVDEDGEIEDGIWEMGDGMGGGVTSSHSPLATSHSAWAQRKRPKRLLFLSRIHPKKGLDMLAPVWGRLTREFPDWELLIVGPDEGGYQAMIEKMMAESGCGDTCRIHPAVTGAEKHALLRTANVFVLPSYSEGHPMAVLEAAAHRLPVVQTTECNFPELTASGGAWECLPETNALEKTLREALAADDVERAERGGHRERSGRERIHLETDCRLGACRLRDGLSLFCFRRKWKSSH